MEINLNAKNQWFLMKKTWKNGQKPIKYFRDSQILSLKNFSVSFVLLVVKENRNELEYANTAESIFYSFFVVVVDAGHLPQLGHQSTGE